MSLHQALNLILELDEATIRCTRDILRQRDCLDQFREIPSVVPTFVVIEGEVIKDLDLEPKIDAMMRDFFESSESTNFKKSLRCCLGSSDQSPWNEHPFCTNWMVSDQRTIIESKSKVHYSRNKIVVAKVSTDTSTSGISPDVAELKDMVKALLLDKKSQKQAPATVKAVEESCVTYGGAHSYRNYPAIDGNVYCDNIQEFVSQASAVNYNQGNTSYRPPMMSNQIRPPGFPLDDLVSKFINQFFPPSKTTNLRNEITNFQQRFDKSFSESWDRFKDLLRACPHHGFSKLHQLDTFYNALNSKDQDSLNSAADGNFFEKMPHECLAIIDSKSKVRYLCNKPVVAKLSMNTSTSGISLDVAKLKDMVKALLIDKKSQNQAPATVKAVEESWDRD
nr:reverse transcriptase domain-containing protein [Tanacetum cinerariifolium]